MSEETNLAITTEVTTEAAMEETEKDALLETEGISLPAEGEDEESIVISDSRLDELEEAAIAYNLEHMDHFDQGFNGRDAEYLNREDSPISTPEAGAMIYAKYNGKAIPLEKDAAESWARSFSMPVEDCVATFQKGLNYDHVVSERDQLRQGGGGPSPLRELLGSPAFQHLGRREQPAPNWGEFQRTYPGLDQKDIPSQVLEECGKGSDPVKAMLRYEVDSLSKQLKNMQVNQGNHSRAMGSVRTEAALETDDFLSGFWAGD